MYIFFFNNIILHIKINIFTSLKKFIHSFFIIIILTFNLILLLIFFIF